VTGRPALGLLSRLRATPVGVAELREAALETLPGLTGAGLSAVVLDAPGAGSVVLLREAERSVRVDLADLAEQFTRDRVPATPEALSAALQAWVACRPVTDAAAAAGGLAVLDWTDQHRRAVGWRVVVPRGDLARPWSPSRSAGGDAVERTRADALDHAAAVRVDGHVEGPVALWAHPAIPVLATAALVAPERLLARTARAGLPLRDAHVVVTPHRPVALAEPPVAARLAGSTGEPCVRLPWRTLADLPWV
jgi:hypothetical protein